MKPVEPNKSLILGAHLSIAGGLHNAFFKAVELGCNALQIFTTNANTWREKRLSDQQISDFAKARNQSNIHAIAAHASYLINLAGMDPEFRTKSLSALEQELVRCGQLGIPWLVIHPGSHMGQGEKIGISQIIDAVNSVFERLPDNAARLLFETTAGQGSALGNRFEQLAEMMNGISDQNRVGICLDTCHIFAAGYDISSPEGYRETFRRFDAIIGMEKLFVVHVNDANKECGSRVDRHTHIGEGRIGLDGFNCLINDIRLTHIPKILETPKIKDGQNADPENLERLRSLFKAIDSAPS